ncbi:hypothetical protein [Plantactinospora sonchi]|uniref:Uncharacterized protein n=1 Tax=Plantactinospora sonchi TaxID=1544735 RepID=A0ABU7S013_9ACTN
MRTGGASGGTPEPGSAREEAERLVAAALAMAQTAASGMRYRAGARDLVGTVGQVISDVLDQVAPPSTGTPAEPPSTGTPAGQSSTGTPAGHPPTEPAGPPPTSGVAGQPTGSAGEAPHPGDDPVRETAGPAGDGATRHGFATGGPECCVCPVCRVVTVLRDPSPELVERLATGAGDLAAGVASLLRAFSAVANSAGPRTTADDSRSADSDVRDGWSAAGDAGAYGAAAGEGPTAGPVGAGAEAGRAERGGADRPAPADAEDQAPGTEPDSRPSAPRVVRDVPGGSAQRHADSVWREATRTGHDSGPAVESDVWAAATRAASAPPATGEFSDPGGRPAAPGAEPVDQVGPAGPVGRRPSVPASRAPEGPVDARPAEPGTSDSGA